MGGETGKNYFKGEKPGLSHGKGGVWIGLGDGGGGKKHSGELHCSEKRDQEATRNSVSCKT